MGLWKTTVIIWSDYDPSNVELSDLARDAEVGDSYATNQETVYVESKDLLIEEIGDGGLEFFNLLDDDEDEDDDRDCDDTCLPHADWCDGYCNHFDHKNACLSEPETSVPVTSLRKTSSLPPLDERTCIIEPGMSDEAADDCTMHNHE